MRKKSVSLKPKSTANCVLSVATKNSSPDLACCVRRSCAHCVLDGLQTGILSRACVLNTAFCRAMPEITLTYFNMEAAAEKVRLALVMTGTPFEDKRVNFEQWMDLKPSAKYGQLPLLTVDGVQMAQSPALLRWVARKFGDGSLYPQVFLPTHGGSLQQICLSLSLTCTPHFATIRT